MRAPARPRLRLRRAGLRACAWSRERGGGWQERHGSRRPGVVATWATPGTGTGGRGGRNMRRQRGSPGDTADLGVMLRRRRAMRRAMRVRSPPPAAPCTRTACVERDRAASVRTAIRASFPAQSASSDVACAACAPSSSRRGTRMGGLLSPHHRLLALLPPARPALRGCRRRRPHP